MTKICQYCKTPFDTGNHGNATKFCSRECRDMHARKRNHMMREAKAKELGVSIDELKKMVRRKEVTLRFTKSNIKRPKTYREIQAENRRRPIVSGWRGAPVMGGGSIHHNDPYLKPSEYVRA